MGRAHEILEQGLNKLGLDFEIQSIDRLLEYILLLKKWNKAFNLTAIQDLEEMVVRHLLDSLAVAPYITKERCLDVGTGAGLPGIPLAILYPEKQFCLLDGNFKKIRFVRQVVVELQLSNVESMNCRVEMLRNVDEVRPFPMIISRAFSSLNTMTQLCYPLLEARGALLAMKGKVTEKELNELKISPNASYEVTVEHLNVPLLNEERHLVIIQ